LLNKIAQHASQLWNEKWIRTSEGHYNYNVALCRAGVSSEIKIPQGKKEKKCWNGERKSEEQRGAQPTQF
jgi:hypothetical protein